MKTLFLTFSVIIKHKLTRIFYQRPTLLVAKEMLGKFLIFKNQIGQIIETEAYLGPEDQASHARFKSRKRNFLMFGQAGIAYVYFTYGMHYMLNIVTEKEGVAGAVLIRSLKPIQGIINETNGPGKLTKALHITEAQNGLDVTRDILYLEDWGINSTVERVIATPRIGIDYAGADKEHLWRFVLESTIAESM